MQRRSYLHLCTIELIEKISFPPFSAQKENSIQMH